MHILWGSHAVEQQKDSLKSFRPELIAVKCIFVYCGCVWMSAPVFTLHFFILFFSLCVCVCLPRVLASASVILRVVTHTRIIAFSPETTNTQTASNLPWLSPQLPRDLGLVNYNTVLTVMGQKGTLNLKWVWTQSSLPGGEMCFYVRVCDVAGTIGF